VCLTVNDGSLDSDPSCTLAVVYDRSGGYTYGWGWFTSPAGAYKPGQSVSGTATFSFVSRYLRGATEPSGTTEFRLWAAGFYFRSISYDWLVINRGGSRAQFKGSGTVNWGLDPNGQAYKFMLWATDKSLDTWLWPGTGSKDTFRIRIWWEDADGVEHVLYDNGVEQKVSVGSILTDDGS
jgi:hypothetical protein